jgi:hypothetical protein
MSPLILKRAKVSRPSGQWRDDDYHVICEGSVVGRVFLSPAAPQYRHRMWTLGYAITQAARRRTDTSRLAKPRWPRSPRAGAAKQRAGKVVVLVFMI